MAISDWAGIRERNSVRRGDLLHGVPANVGYIVDRIQAARLFRERLNQERNLRDAAIRVETEKAGEQAAASRLAIDAGLAGADLPEGGDPDAYMKALTQKRLRDAAAYRAGEDEQVRALRKAALDLRASGQDRAADAAEARLRALEEYRNRSLGLREAGAKEKVAGADALRDFTNTVLGVSDPSTLDRLQIPAGVDPKAALAAINSRKSDIRSGENAGRAKAYLDFATKANNRAEKAAALREAMLILKPYMPYGQLDMDMLNNEGTPEAKDTWKKIQDIATKAGITLGEIVAPAVAPGTAAPGAGAPAAPATPAPPPPGLDPAGPATKYRWIGGESGTDILFTTSPTAPAGFKPYPMGGGAPGTPAAPAPGTAPQAAVDPSGYGAPSGAQKVADTAVPAAGAPKVVENQAARVLLLEDKALAGTMTDDEAREYRRLTEGK